MSKNHHSKEFRIMRSVVLWLHDFKCYNCDLYPITKDVHHLDHDNSKNTLQNLIPLCQSCHKFYHKIPPQPQFSAKKIVVLLLKKVNFYSGTRTAKKP